MRVGDPNRGNTHEQVDDRRGEPGTEHVEARQAERAIDQPVRQHGVERNGGDGDPQRRLGPVHRAHEVAQRHEHPGRHHAPAQPQQIARRKLGRARLLSERDQNVLAPELQRGQRHTGQDGGPQPDTQRPPHEARIARAEGLRGERRHRGHRAHAERERDEQHRVRERGRGHHVIAEPAEQRQVRGHHGDLAELADGQRHRQLQRLRELAAPKPSNRRRARAGGGKGLD